MFKISLKQAFQNLNYESKYVESLQYAGNERADKLFDKLMEEHLERTIHRFIMSRSLFGQRSRSERSVAGV